MKRTLFISYRVADTRPTAGRLAAELRRIFGDDTVFLDYRSIDAGGQWPEQLQIAVGSAAVLLVLIGKNWLTAHDEYGRRRIDLADDWVRQEIAAGLKGTAKVLPLLVNDTKPLPSVAIADLPDIAKLATAQARPLRDVDWDSDFSNLVDWLEAQGFEPVTTLAVAEERADAEPEWHGKPYRGLSAFGTEDARIYYGRERETDELLRRVEARRVVAVIGPSGSGKSSLVAAGLLPQLSEDWLWVRFSPAEAGDNPLRSLARRLAPHVPSVGGANALAERLFTDPAVIDTVASKALAGRPAGAQLLLFIDQFEELFTQRVDETYRTALVDLIAAISNSERARLVLTLRADYTDHCTRYEALTSELRDGTFLLGAPGMTGLKAMIEGPARAAGLEVEPELVDSILEDAGTEPGALALVEFTLEQLYEGRTDNKLTLASYDALDGVRGAIEVQGEEAVRDASQQVDETALRNVFHALAAVDERSGAVRKRAQLETFDTPEREIVDRLVKHRLLVTGEDEKGRPTVEVAHEAVLREWGRFGRWLDENRELELWRQRLATYRRGGALLSRGLPLTTALDWLEKRPSDLDDAERNYIIRSRRAARRFNGLILSGLASVFLLVAAVGAFTVWTARAGLTNKGGMAALAFRVGLSGMSGLPLPEMLPLQGGSFTMGAQGSGNSPRDGSQAMVTLDAFSIGKFEVTFEQYDAFVGATFGHAAPADSGWGRGNRPVIDVSWHDARAYADWLEMTTGEQYRLPSEAEWEYAARAGTETTYWWGDEIGDGRANCNGCGGEWGDKQRTAPVGEFDANAFGLHDTSGNVWEWVADCWQDDLTSVPRDGAARVDAGGCNRRVVRGGSWIDGSFGLGSADRDGSSPNYSDAYIGFRVARDP